ncbi:hypothetical protein BH10PSE17_BH10PSE17_12450 [soil metagenome]
MRRSLVVSNALIACIGLALAGHAEAQKAPREPLNISGQFKGAKDATQLISDGLPQAIYDAIKSRKLSLMVYTKNFTFSNSKTTNYCWAMVGPTTPSGDERGERLPVNAVTGIFRTEKDMDCRLKGIEAAVADGARLMQMIQIPEVSRTLPKSTSKPDDANELMVYSALNQAQNDYILGGVPERFLAGFDVHQVRLFATTERSILGDDVICVATAALTAPSPNDRTPRMPPELQVGTAILLGAGKQKAADNECWQAALGGALTRLFSRPWDTVLVADVAATREDYSRLPTSDSVRAGLAKYDKAHPAKK